MPMWRVMELVFWPVWQFELAEWAGGKLKVIEAKEQQQAMLRKLESYHGVAL